MYTVLLNCGLLLRCGAVRCGALPFCAVKHFSPSTSFSRREIFSLLLNYVYFCSCSCGIDLISCLDLFSLRGDYFIYLSRLSVVRSDHYNIVVVCSLSPSSFALISFRQSPRSLSKTRRNLRSSNHIASSPPPSPIRIKSTS